MMLGEKIYHLRKRKGLSQEELASQLTISRQAVSRWELGESVPDTENIVQLSKIFNVSTDYLLNDEYESDSDIPAVQANSANIKAKYRSTARKISYCLFGITLIGLLSLWIMSMISVNDPSVDFALHDAAYLSFYRVVALVVSCLSLAGGLILLLRTSVNKNAKTTH